MKYCSKCGYMLADEANFFQRCGVMCTQNSIIRTDSNNTEPKPAHPANFKRSNNREKKRLWVVVVFWILFWPIMLIITIAKSSKFSKPTKIILITLFIILLVVISALKNEDKNSTFSENSSSSTTNSSISETQSLFSEVITNDVLRNNFLVACEQIGIDIFEIENLEKVDDWSGGERYSFTYKSVSLRVYCNIDSSINAIKLGNETDIYKQGFEPYQIDDYIVDSSTAVKLQQLSEEYVKSQLNYPATANFSWLGWAYGRNHDIYFVSNNVTAQNAFGVEEEIPFVIRYKIESDKIEMLYFELSGNTIVNKMSNVSIPERRQLETVHSGSSTKSNSSTNINLIDGQLGDYGENVNLNGHDVIIYNIPTGTYSISNNGKWCKIYVIKNDTENTITQTLEFFNYGDSKTITINENEHIELTENANIILTLTA